jgi:hypothetical protein
MKTVANKLQKVIHATESHSCKPFVIVKKMADVYRKAKEAKDKDVNKNLKRCF